MGFKWKLRTVMADKKMTLKDLAEKLGVSIRTVQTLKSDNPSLTISRLEQICQALNCQISDLIEFIEEKPLQNVENLTHEELIQNLKFSFSANNTLSENDVDAIVRKMVKGV